MISSRDAILSAALIAAAIVAHAYIAQQPRYQFMASTVNPRKITRGDTRTGEAVVCEWNTDAKDNEFYECPSHGAPAK
jgi:hypothetical protein